MPTKKSNHKTAALSKYTLRRNVREYIDFDYTAKLSPKEKEWLSKFIEEYYCGKVKKNDRKAIHKTKRQRKDCYDRNNQINRDLYAIKKCCGQIFPDYSRDN